MSDQISWHVVLSIKQGQFDNFQAPTREMVDFTRTESGVLSYQRFVSEDGNFAHVYERYADSAAAQFAVHRHCPPRCFPGSEQFASACVGSLAGTRASFLGFRRAP
jgi:quinol monooxygenase YgiN